MGAISPVSGAEDSKEGAVRALQKNGAPRKGDKKRREGGSEPGSKAVPARPPKPLGQQDVRTALCTWWGTRGVEVSEEDRHFVFARDPEKLELFLQTMGAMEGSEAGIAFKNKDHSGSSD